MQKEQENFPRPVIKAMLDMQFRYFLWSNTQVPPQGDSSTEEEEDDKSYSEWSSSDPEKEKTTQTLVNPTI